MNPESALFGVTMRGWIAVSLVATVCVMSLLKIKVEEPLYTLVMMAVSFYLGSKSSMMKIEPKESNDIEKRVA